MHDGEHHLDAHPSHPRPFRARYPDLLREATCLAHSVPGVSLRLTTVTGEEMLISRGCLGATLDPCQLRSVLIADGTDAEAARRSVHRTEIVGGIVHLGGGLYQRSTSDEERWFVTSLPHHAVIDIVERCPVADGGPERADSTAVVTVKPDSDLGLCAVRVHDERTGAEHRCPLDAIATWILGACLVDELIAVAAGQPQH